MSEKQRTETRTLLNFSDTEYIDLLQFEGSNITATYQELLAGVISGKTTSKTLKEISEEKGKADYAVISDCCVREGKIKYEGGDNIVSSNDWETYFGWTDEEGRKTRFAGEMFAITPKLAEKLARYNIIGDWLKNRIKTASVNETKTVFVEVGVAKSSRYFIGSRNPGGH